MTSEKHKFLLEESSGAEAFFPSRKNFDDVNEDYRRGMPREYFNQFQKQSKIIRTQAETIENIQLENEALKERVKSLLSPEKSQTELSEKRNEIERLEKTITVLYQELSDLKFKKENLMTHHQVIRDKEALIKQKEVELSEIETVLNEKKREIDNLNTNAWRDIQEKIQYKTLQLNRIKKRTVSILEELKTLRGKKDDFIKELETLAREKDDLSAEKKQTEEKINRRIERLAFELKQKEKDSGVIEKEISEIRNQRDRLSGERDALKKALETKHKELESISRNEDETRKRLSDMSIEYERTRKQNDELRENNQWRKVENERLLNEKKSIIDKYGEKEKNTREKLDAITLDTREAELKKSLTQEELGQVIKNLEEKKKESEDFIKSVSAREEKISSLDDSLRERKTMLQIVSSEVELKRKQLESKTSTLEELNRQIKELEKGMEPLKETHKKTLENMKLEENKMREELDVLKETVQKALARQKEVENQIARSRPQLERVDELKKIMEDAGVDDVGSLVERFRKTLRPPKEVEKNENKPKPVRVVEKKHARSTVKPDNRFLIHLDKEDVIIQYDDVLNKMKLKEITPETWAWSLNDNKWISIKEHPELKLCLQN